MACVHEKFRSSIQKDVSSQQLWDHLETMYDMSALHESEIVPFPNDETEFALPEGEFNNIVKREEKPKAREEDRLSRSKESLTDEKETPTPSGKQITKERQKEAQETEGIDNTPKRKRTTRQNQQEPVQKPNSPAGASSSIKRRRT